VALVIDPAEVGGGLANACISDTCIILIVNTVSVTYDHSAHFKGQYVVHSSFVVRPIFHSLPKPAARVSRATVVSATTHSFISRLQQIGGNLKVH
jgi:hypothetical protein